MDALEYLKIRGRMTSNCNKSCGNCPLYYDNNGKKKTCTEFEFLYPNEAISIISKWEKEHPLKTNKDKYKEIIRETFGDNFDIEICGSRPYENIPDCRCDSMMDCGDCVKFWNSEYIEKEKE